MKKILVTGASGFVGQFLCKTLSKSGRSVLGAVRSANSNLIDHNIKYISVGDISFKKNWKDHLIDVNCIIHCAGRAHKMNDNNVDAYRLTNLESTKRLAEQAADAGVKRLIFLSSIKVNGESTDHINSTKKFFYTDIPNPQDPYAISKLKAEKALWQISLRTGLEIVVVRLPLVYGHGVKGNMARLIELIKSRVPFPLSIVKNKRSMIGIDNLIDLLIRCIDHVDASGKTFLVSDDDDLSTPQIINLIALSMKKKVYFFPLPLFLLKIIFSIIGKRREINRLIGSLSIDINYVKETLNWTPPISVKEGIIKMVNEK
jgi:nucleoside-diphosphate-sugar epimerase